MSLFAIGVGGSGAKCIEALTHLHACGLLHNDDGSPLQLCTFFVEPDEQSTLLSRAETAISRYQEMRRVIDGKAKRFAAGELIHYGSWNPLKSANGALSLEQVFPKAVMQTQASGLASLFDCLYLPEEQSANLEVGFRGRPPIGSAVMSRLSLSQTNGIDEWNRFLNAIQDVAGSGGHSPIVHLFGSVFGGTGASGVPTLGQMIKSWLRNKGYTSIRVNASLLLPYFDFYGQAENDTGVHAEAKNFQLNTDAALQYLRASGNSCFDSVYLLGSDMRVKYPFNIGGVAQDNDAHIVELLAALGMRHKPGADYAYVLSRANKKKIVWEDIPDNEIVGEALARGARFAIAWSSNISLELQAAQQVPMSTFLAGAPWARQFFQPTGEASGTRGGRPSIRSAKELAIKVGIDSYMEIFLQWLYQLTSNTGIDFSQDLFESKLLQSSPHYENSLGFLVKGSARPTVRQAEKDTVDAIKIAMDKLSPSDIPENGVAGLADTLWKLSI